MREVLIVLIVVAVTAVVGLVIASDRRRRLVWEARQRRAAVDAAAAAVIAEVMAEAEGEQRIDDEIDAFRQRLERWPIPEIDGEQIGLRYHDVSQELREVTVRGVLVGEGGFYLDCWWPARNDTRLFHGGRVAQVITSDGRRFDEAITWIMASGYRGLLLGDRLGRRP